MNISKKLLCAVLACVMLSPTAALARETDADNLISAELFADAAEKAKADKDNMTLFDEDETTVTPPTDEEKELILLLADSISRREEEFEIPEDYIISMDRFSELYSSFLGHYIQTECPEILDIPQARTTGFPERADTVFFTYRKSDEEYNQSRMAVYIELDKIMALLDDTMTDAEKVLAVHDYIASNYEYDERVFSDDINVVMQAGRDLDTMIIEKKGVCEGYTKLFKFVMDNIGIECVSVPSDECQHIWNKVKIDDKWYNVDITTDDPLINMASNVLHTFFLISDEEIRATDSHSHYTWNEFKWDLSTPVETADDDSYSDLIIRGLEGPIVYKGGAWYGFDEDNNLAVFDITNNTSTAKYTETSDYKWFLHGGHSAFWYTHSSIALFDGNLYFNSPNKVYRYEPALNEAYEVYDFEAKNPDKKDVSQTYIYGVRAFDDDTLSIEYTTSPYDYQDEAGKITYSHMDAVIPIIERAYKCGYIYGYTEDGQNEITFKMPYKCQKSSNILVAQYADNAFIGFADVEWFRNKFIFTPDEDCATLKTFIWDKETSKPFTPSLEMQAQY